MEGPTARRPSRSCSPKTTEVNLKAVIADLEQKQEKCVERILTPLLDENEDDYIAKGKLLREASTIEWILVGIKERNLNYRSLLRVAAQLNSKHQVPNGYDHEGL